VKAGASNGGRRLYRIVATIILRPCPKKKDYKLHEVAGFVLVALGGLSAIAIAQSGWTVWTFIPKIIAIVVDLWVVTIGALLILPEGPSKNKSIDAILDLNTAILSWLTDRINGRRGENPP